MKQLKKRSRTKLLKERSFLHVRKLKYESEVKNFLYLDNFINHAYRIRVIDKALQLNSQMLESRNFKNFELN